MLSQRIKQTLEVIFMLSQRIKRLKTTTRPHIKEEMHQWLILLDNIRPYVIKQFLVKNTFFHFSQTLIISCTMNSCIQPHISAEKTPFYLPRKTITLFT